MAFKDLQPHQKLIAVHTDFMRHPEFCILGGVTQIGKVEVSHAVPTAGTDGEDVYYNPDFIKDMTRGQLRYLVGHESLHKALHHCTEYATLKERHPEEFAQAIDYVVNGTLESMDTGEVKFLERPTNVPPLVNSRYDTMGVPEVVRALLQKKKEGGAGKATQPMDTHMHTERTEGNAEEMDAVQQKIDDAVRHGEIMQGQMRSEKGAGSGALGGFRESVTDWRPYLRRFVQEMCEGDDQSRFSPPNKRMLPMDIIMPSRFSEATGELIVACDTSGSMGHILPQVFGEVARVCQVSSPERVRIIWWDTKVAGEQVIERKNFASIATQLAPRGGGGTTVSCVARYVREKKYKPKATIMISDGYVEAQYETVPGNLLWGIVGNRGFVPLRGKVLHITEV